MQENNLDSQTQQTINTPVIENPTTVVDSENISKPVVKQNNFLAVLLSVLLLISLLIAGFFAYQTQKLVKELTDLKGVEVDANKTASEPVEGPTSNWKTYTNTKFGYSVKYPQDQKVIRLVCENEVDMFYLVLGDGQEDLKPQNCGRDSRFNLEIVASANPYTDDSRYKLTSEKLSIAGVEAIKKTFVAPDDLDGPGELWYVEVQFKKGNFYYNAYTRNKELEKTLDQILSTLKFNESVPTSNWKTYSGKIFSFRYPQTMSLDREDTEDPSNPENIGDMVTLTDSKFKLKVNSNFSGGWGGSVCLVTKDQVVDGHKSQLLYFRKSLPGTDTCLEQYSGIVALIENTVFQHPYPIVVDLQPRDQNGIVDVELFNMFLSTLKINK